MSRSRIVVTLALAAIAAMPAATGAQSSATGAQSSAAGAQSSAAGARKHAGNPPAKTPALNPGSRPDFGLGRAATAVQIRGWDIDVLPDGTGLPKGSGSVADGRGVYDAKCADCHGTFGESTDWIVIAGGVKKGDVERGRPATLTEPAPVRTVGTKMNSAASLWDYIYRAMPLMAPKTLTVEETYAVTAYVLHLNEILPADAKVNEATLAGVKMPNRLGFTEDHGFKSVRGRPDVTSTACMKNCEKDVRVSSELPDHARDAHGNLREQMRWYGPVRGIDTTYPRGESPGLWRSGAFGGAAPAIKTAAGPVDLLKTQGCAACHGVNQRIVGPGFTEIAARYQGDPAAEGRLLGKVKDGSAGAWGAVPMPAQPQVGDADAKSIVQWILSGAKS